MKIKNVIVLFIVIICIIGCGKVNIKETSIGKTNIDKKIDIKSTSSSTNTSVKKPDKETDSGDNRIGNKQSNPYEEKGFASFISDEYDGKMTASGIRYDRNKMTAAHPSLPFETKVLVTNLRNKRTSEVIIIDRFPPTKDRILNVSRRAAVELDFIESGIAKISINIIGNPDQNQ